MRFKPLSSFLFAHSLCWSSSYSLSSGMLECAPKGCSCSPCLCPYLLLSKVPRRAPRSLQLFGSLVISILPNPFTTSQILSSSLSSSNAPVTLGNLLFPVHCYSLNIVSQHWWETLGFIYFFFSIAQAQMHPIL